MDGSSQQMLVQQRRRLEQEELRQYHLLRRRRYLQMERQQQRQRMVMAAMEQQERRRKRYQRALEQRRSSDQQQQQTRRVELDDRLRNYNNNEDTQAAAAVVQDTITAVGPMDTHASFAVTNKLVTLEAIKHQLNTLDVPIFLGDQKQQHLDTRHKSTTTSWSLFKRLVLLVVYENTLMQLLLRLDGVSSDGADGIRQQRRVLVERTSELLDRLDQYKQRYVNGGL